MFFSNRKEQRNVLFFHNMSFGKQNAFLLILYNLCNIMAEDLPAASSVLISFILQFILSHIIAVYDHNPALQSFAYTPSFSISS